MKKIKLLTGLSTLTLGGSIAVTTAACTTYPPYMTEKFTITPSEVNFGGLTSIKNGDTLPYDLKYGDHLTLTLKGAASFVNVDWNVVGGTKELVRDVDYSIIPVNVDQAIKFTILNPQSFEPNTLYTIKAIVEKDEGVFSFKTKDSSALEPKIQVIKNENASLHGGSEVQSLISLGTFELYVSDGEIVKTDESNNLTASFEGENNTGFTSNNLEIIFNSTSYVYAVTLKDGTASENVCIGFVSTSWNTGGKTVKSSSNFTITITEKLVDPTINVVPDYNEQIIGGTEVKSPVTLGVFQLFGTDEKIIKTDETNNLDVVFTGTNNTGFNNNNLQTIFNPTSFSYTVAIKDGTANRVGAVGNVSIIWHSSEGTISAPTNLTATVLNESITTPIKTIYGTDCTTEYTEDQTIPVILNSGVYLQLTDPDDSTKKINAKWIILGGEIYAQLVDTGYTSSNALMIKTGLPQSVATTLVVKAIPEDSTKYADVVFTINVEPDTTTPVITAAQGNTTPVLQYENTQVAVNDTISFGLQNATATQWDVVGASGGSEDDQAQITDVSFADPTNGTLTINKTFYDPAIYTIQATYGNNETITYNLELTGGAVITASITAGGSTQDVIKFRQLSSDLAVGNVLTFTIDNKYKGEVDHWTASYEAYESGAVPGFTSPASGQKVATWTVTQDDIDTIPASSHIYIKAYEKGNSEPLATFTFQAKVHNLTTIKNGNIVFPYASTQVAKGSNLDYTDGNLTGNIDGSATATTGGKWALIEQSQSGDYTASIVDKGGGKKALRVVLLVGGTGVTVVVPFVITVTNSNGIIVYGTTWITYSNITE